MASEPVTITVSMRTWTFPQEGKVVAVLDGPRSGVDVLEKEVDPK